MLKLTRAMLQVELEMKANCNSKIHILSFVMLRGVFKTLSNIHDKWPQQMSGHLIS